MKFKKKPIIVEAINYTGENQAEIAFFTGGIDLDMARHEPQSKQILIKTTEGWLNATPGDWIIKGTHGEFYPCKPDIFKAIYEMVPEEIKFTITKSHLIKDLSKCWKQMNEVYSHKKFEAPESSVYFEYFIDCLFPK